MASEILETHHIVGKLVDLINHARTRVALVSPYVQLWNHLENALKSTASRGASVSMVYRQDKHEEYRHLTEQLLKWRVSVYEFNMLHAKVYINESTCILTSMNLYDVSALNSEEFAISSSDSELVYRVWEYVDGLIARSKPLRADLGKKVAGAISKSVQAIGAATSAVSKAFEQPGFCIRCGTKMPYEFERPLCLSCHTDWARFKKREFTEKHCHSCGTWYKTSVAFPLCMRCYKNQK